MGIHLFFWLLASYCCFRQELKTTEDYLWPQINVRVNIITEQNPEIQAWFCPNDHLHSVIGWCSVTWTATGMLWLTQKWGTKLHNSGRSTGGNTKKNNNKNPAPCAMYVHVDTRSQVCWRSRKMRLFSCNSERKTLPVLFCSYGTRLWEDPAQCDLELEEEGWSWHAVGVSGQAGGFPAALQKQWGWSEVAAGNLEPLNMGTLGTWEGGKKGWGNHIFQLQFSEKYNSHWRTEL